MQKTAAKSLYASVNPLNNKLFYTQPLHSDAEVEAKLEKATKYFKNNRRRGIEAMEERFEKLSNVHALMGQRVPEYAKLMTLEMGKPLGQAEAEILKSMSIIEYFIKHAIEFDQDSPLKTHQLRAYINYDAVGPLFDIVPWNFPFWMPFKSMIPPMVHGNPILLKGAPSTPQCTAAIEQLFRDAGMDDGEF